MPQKNMLRALSMSLALLVVVGLAGWTGVADAACNKSHGNCDANITISVWTGDPTAVCLIGKDVLEIIVNVNCSGQAAPRQRKLLCEVQSNSIVFDALGYTHTISLKGDANWGQAKLNCSLIKYKRKPI